MSAFDQYIEGLKGDLNHYWWLLTGSGTAPGLPRTTNPVFNSPPAPQTQWGMINWTPEMSHEVLVSGGQQYFKDINAVNTTTGDSTVMLAQPSGFSWTPILLGTGVLLVVLIAIKAGK